ncbi:hypothetical protein J6590_032681 [Homalodisca vitripennis]|nr:hypothetical protein J6590_032681 [Homalodisca vitripennis]
MQLRSGQGRMEQLMESLSIKLELLARTTPPASLNICTSVEQTHLKHNAITKMKNPEEVEENHYSVSLQMAKANALLKKTTITKPSLESILTSQEGKTTGNANALKVQRGPPVTAKKLGTDESLEKFFIDNIESSMKINMNYLSPPPPPNERELTSSIKRSISNRTSRTSAHRTSRSSLSSFHQTTHQDGARLLDIRQGYPSSQPSYPIAQ